MTSRPGSRPRWSPRRRRTATGDPAATPEPTGTSGREGAVGATGSTPSRPAETGWAPVSFEDRMARVDFRVGRRPHITVDGDRCHGCTTRACVTACPANLFVPTSDGGIVFNYEQCFECGTCYLVCNEQGAISWTYPDGGEGVVYHRS